MTLTLEDTRLKLLSNGYAPTPCAGKRPVLDAWQKLLEPTALEVERWPRTAPAATNTGILTRPTPTLDIDILNDEAAAAVEALVRERFEERGFVLARFGRPPKRAIPFRTDNPFPKILVNIVAPGVAPDDKEKWEKLELLADGQQFVAYGIHPLTHKEYSWHGDGPLEIKREDLPYIHAEDARALVDDAVQILNKRFGYHLAPTGRSRPGNGARAAAHQAGSDWQLLFDNICNGRSLHDSLRDAAAKMIRAGTHAGTVVNQLRALMEASLAAHDDRWQERFAEIPRLVEGAEAKLASESAKGNEPLPKLVPLRFIKGEEIPPREWIAPHWIPKGTLTLVQGNGGDGKTPLVQQLLTSCASGSGWIALPVKECTTAGFFTEDTERDLKERQAAINANYCLEETPAKMHLFPRLGQENELVEFDKGGNPRLTPFFHQVREAAFDLHAGLVVLDVLVDLFGGDEIRRRQVRAFMRPLLGLAADLNAGVVLTAHVSQAGIQSGGGHSGSTDWSNAARSRLYLNRPKDDEGVEIDTDARLLTRKKANFATIGDTIKLRWKDGILVPEESIPSYFRRPVEDVFLALLDEHNGANRRPLSESSNATNYAPRVFSNLRESERDNYRQADFQRAMEILFKGRKIKSVSYGRKGDERRKIVRNVDLGNDREEHQ
jgi:RecA-family ATPase